MNTSNVTLLRIHRLPLRSVAEQSCRQKKKKSLLARNLCRIEHDTPKLRVEGGNVNNQFNLALILYLGHCYDPYFIQLLFS